MVTYIKNNYIIKLFFLILCGIFLCTALSFAFTQDISFEATVDRNVSVVGTAIKLNLIFNGIQNIPAPNLPDIPDFNWRYLGPSTLMSMVNGRISSSVTHTYLLIPEKAGILEIPSLSIAFKGKTYSSKPIPLEIIPSSSSRAQDNGQQDKQERPKEELGDKLFLTINLSKDSAYVNEKIGASIKLYIHSLSLRDIAYPVIENDAFLVDSFSQPKQYQEILNGLAYNVIDFNTDIYGLYPGEFRLKPTELSCSVIKRRSPSDIFDNFFGQYEKYPIIIKSIGVPINILPLPEGGKPKSFDGAMGNFNFTLQVKPIDLQVGDPITLTMTISGTGNFNTVNPPKLSIASSFKTYEPETRQEARFKTFEQVIIPRNDKITHVPSISFSFFNTDTLTYKTITTAPVPIKVNPLQKGQELKVFEMSRDFADRIKRVETLGRDIVYLKGNPGSIRKKSGTLYKNKALLIMLFLPALVVILVIITQARKDYLASDIRYARRLAAPRKAKKNLINARGLLKSKETHKFYDAVFKALQEYIGDKFHLSTAGITSNVIDELRARDVDTRILDELKTCFDMCDRSRYAPSSIHEEEARSTLKMLENIINGMEKIKA